MIGLTATPWRLAKNEGFQHLFDCLILGPQIKDMQSNDWLADTQVLMPASDKLILGGQPASTGDYNESGIELANQDRPNVMTSGALEFWQAHSQDRQTIIYAVSVEHAANLATVFNNVNVPADVIFGNTPHEERAWRIRQFSDGELQVLINVAVATEGFDLPDAACVVLTRPTLSLALYLQMVGRGLRPKPDGGNCLILDLAGNVERHGMPDDERLWSLEPRGRQSEGNVPPIVRCPDCDGVSPAASHNCQICECSFGKSCQRCGSWRGWKRWSTETYCGGSHDLVCDMCHPDAHKLANLPVEEGLREVLKRESSGSHSNIDPSELHTLEEVQAAICEVAEALVYAMRIGDIATFNRMTGQLRRLLRKETLLKKAKMEEIKTNLEADITPAFLEFRADIEEIYKDFGGRKVIELFFDLEKNRLTYQYETKDGVIMWDKWTELKPGE